MTESAARRIVVGVDGSAGSVRALKWAADIAAATGGRLEVVTVWEPPIEFGWTYPVALRTKDWRAECNAVADVALTEAFGAFRPPGLTVIGREGYPSAELIHASEGATMLVVGNRGHGGFASLLLGSVSVKCTEHAHCPVVVVRPDLAVEQTETVDQARPLVSTP